MDITEENPAVVQATDTIYEHCKQDILQRKTESSIEEKLSLLAQLNEFKFGRSLIESKKLTRYWRHFLLTYPFQAETVTTPALFSELMHQFPISLAMQQRYQIFLEQIQNRVKNDAKLLSIPSGLVEDLAYLNYKNIEEIELIAWDDDAMTLEQARGICQTRGIAQWLTCVKEKSWALNEKEQFDVIACHGLTIYEKSNERVLDFYERAFHALKPDGEFISAYITPSPSEDSECEWDFSNINAAYLRKQNVVFFDVLNLEDFYCRKTVETRKMLSQAGFENIEFHFDKARMFPSFVASK
tara:strand:+ start:95706 stop:96602 length:897 start_codon:yes stop_codon:yes gene_type:complete